jgi:hypothetical protein
MSDKKWPSLEMTDSFDYISLAINNKIKSPWAERILLDTHTYTQNRASQEGYFLENAPLGDIIIVWTSSVLHKYRCYTSTIQRSHDAARDALKMQAQLTCTVWLCCQHNADDYEQLF